MDGVSKTSFGILAGITFTVLVLGLSSQTAYAGNGDPCIGAEDEFVCHVWKGGGATPDRWFAADNWFAGQQPDQTETHPIYIGCADAPTPQGEGPAPTNVSVTFDDGNTDIFLDEGGMLNLCSGSTLTISDDNDRLRITGGLPQSPILIDFINFGTIINNGFFAVINEENNFGDTIDVVLDNRGTIINNNEIQVRNDGNTDRDVRVEVKNTLGSTINNNANSAFTILNSGDVESQSETNDVQVLLDNDGELSVVGEGSFSMGNTGNIENVGAGSGGINLNILTDNDGDITISGSSTFNMINQGSVINTDGDDDNDAEVNIQFLDSSGTLTIEGEGTIVRMQNDGNISGDENPDLDIEFRDFFGRIDIGEGSELLMFNQGIVTNTGDETDDDAEIQIQFDDINPGAEIHNLGTITMGNGGQDGRVEAPCNASIDVEITDNLGLIENDGLITLRNTADATNRLADNICTTGLNFRDSEIEVEIDNGDEQGGGFPGTIINDGTIHIFNTGDAHDIEVELNSEATSTLTNRDGGEIFLENRGVASDELDVRIDQDEATSSITNECGALIEIEDTSQQIPSLGSFVGIRNIGTITNFGTGEITLNDNGVKTEVDKIVTVGVPPTDPNQIVIFAACKPLEPTKFRLLGHDNVKHEIITINTLTGLASVLGATGFDSGASGLATSRVSLDTAIGTFPKGTHFGVFMDDTPAALASAGETDNGFGVQPQEEAPVDGSWIGFNFFGVGTDASGSPYTFTCEATGCTLTVTDCFARGDIFEVFESAVSQGSTSATASLDGGSSDPDVCLADPLMSSGTFEFGPGPHSVQVTTAASPHGGGGAFLKVDEGILSDSKDWVVIVDPATGFSTKVVLVDMGTGAVGVAFGEDNLFYVTDGTANKLYTVDLVTGLKTFKGDFKDSITGDPVKVINNLQFDTKSSKFIAIGIASPQSVYSIDTDATATKIAELSPIVEDVCAIARAPDTGEWFSVKQGSNELVKIDIVTGDVTTVGSLGAASSGKVCGLVFEEVIFVSSKTSGSTGHEPPTIGKSLDGVRQVVDGGMSVDGQTWTVTQGYHQEFELLQMLTSPHTISNVIHCSKGVQYCNYIAVGFMGLTDDFNNPVMTVSASKDHLGTWTIDWYDPNDFISDPDDAAPVDIVFVPQIIDNKLLGTSFTIDFKNKDTGQLKMGIQVRDSYLGVRNFYFNEGVEFIDADAYLAVESAYDNPIEVESVCFGQNNPDRNSCQFAKIKDWTTANAEETLRQMMGNQYEYEQ